MTATTDLKFTKAPHNEEFERMWQDEWPDTPVPQRYIIGPLAEPLVNALVNREPVDLRGEEMRWHISISRPDRLPTWEDCVAAAHELRPGVVFVLGVPPRSWWINVHRYVLHLWETSDTLLVNMWREERRGDRHS